MAVVAVSMVRDEIDVIGPWLTHLLAEGFDRIVVADNGSLDGTRQAVEQALGDRVVLVDDPDPAYHQGAKMSALAGRHCQPGDICVPVDADELWFSLDGTPLADTLRAIPADVFVARPIVHVPSDLDDPDDPNPFTRIRRRQHHPEPQAKMAFRWQPGAVIAMGAHGVFGAGPRYAEGCVGVRHFQWRTLGQAKRKARQGTAALRAGNIHELHGTHWRNLARMGDGEFEVWWKDYCTQDTVHDPAPWRR